MNPPLRRLLPALLALAFALGACGGDDRPEPEDWEPVWLSVEALVPGQDEIADDREDACSPALGELRARRAVLLPTPTDALDELARAWLAAAEGLLLDCPADADERAAELDELERLAEQVRAGLAAVSR